MKLQERLKTSRVVLINYATPEFVRSQRLNTLSAKVLGGIKYCVSYSPRDISWRFRRQNHRILGIRRGGGLWLWKPYFIFKTLRKLRNGDVLFYCDSGSVFLRSVEPLVAIAREVGSVACFSVGLPEVEWSKRDAFVFMNAERPEIIETDQRLASFHVWYRSAESLELAHWWLHYCCDYRIISDAPSVCGLPEDPRFRENRHDQTVFSLLTKKSAYRVFPIPAGIILDQATELLCRSHEYLNLHGFGIGRLISRCGRKCRRPSRLSLKGF